MSASPHPRPDPQHDDDARFWSALREGELRIQCCSACHTFRHPPRPVCARCGARESQPVRVEGTGEVWSSTVIHPPTLPAFADRTPYSAVVVRLDEGVFLVSNLVDTVAEVDGAVDDGVIGTRVELAITEVEEGLFLPLFRPARSP